MASAAPTFSDLSNTTVTVNVSGGVPEYANLAALRLAASSSSNGAAVVVDDGTGTLRMYQWNNASVAADDGLSVIASDDGGVGRWILVF